MTTSPAQVLQALLANPRDLANVTSVTTPDVTYVSLSEDNPELKGYLLWTGTNQGPEAIVRAFERINNFALLAPREAERRKNSLRPVSRGHVRYLGNPGASAGF